MDRQLYVDVRDFVRRHRGCGFLRTDVETSSWNRHQFTIECSCGTRLERWLEENEGSYFQAATVQA